MGGAWDLGAAAWLCVEDLVLTSAENDWRWEPCCCAAAAADEEVCLKLRRSEPD